MTAAIQHVLLMSLLVWVGLLNMSIQQASCTADKDHRHSSIYNGNTTTYMYTGHNRNLNSVFNKPGDLGGADSAGACDHSTRSNTQLQSYFDGMASIYRDAGMTQTTCLPLHKDCGWGSRVKTGDEKDKKLPLFVLSIGLEGAGHHLWTELLGQPVFDCVWTNARHYHRDIADGVPRNSAHSLKMGLDEHFKIRKQMGKDPCRSIYDAEDSFPTGAIRKSGRVFMRPDIVTLQQLDGEVLNIKYLIIVRNTTDTALSALRRNFFETVDQELRTVEHTLTYIEAALRGVPCHKTFIAHYEHILAEPKAFVEPLSIFLELDGNAKKALRKRLLSKNGSLPSRTIHKLTQYSECSDEDSEEQCYRKIASIAEQFFSDRSFMWPTFAGNGFNFMLR